MNATEEFTWQTFVNACEAARHAGGIHVQDAMNGTPVPDGWVLEPYTQYFIPAKVSLLKPIVKYDSDLTVGAR